jgi:putative endonuclease
MSKARVRAYRDGVLAETLAAILFSLKGYRIIARRYRSPVGEVDLVATNGERLAFVEVKRRKTQADAAFAVTAKQKRRIMRAAQYWLSSHPPPHFVDYAIGFDVVLCALWSWPHRAKNAFPI